MTLSYNCFFSVRRLVTAMVVYGFLFYISDMAGSPYLNVALMYISDALGALVGWATIQR